MSMKLGLLEAGLSVRLPWPRAYPPLSPVARLLRRLPSTFLIAAAMRLVGYPCSLGHLRFLRSQSDYGGRQTYPHADQQQKRETPDMTRGCYTEICANHHGDIQHE